VQASPPFICPRLIRFLLRAVHQIGRSFRSILALPHAMAAPTPVSAYLAFGHEMREGGPVSCWRGFGRCWRARRNGFYIVATTGLITLVSGGWSLRCSKDDFEGAAAPFTVFRILWPDQPCFWAFRHALCCCGSPCSHIINHATFQGGPVHGARGHPSITKTHTRDIKRLGGLRHLMR